PPAMIDACTTRLRRSLTLAVAATLLSLASAVQTRAFDGEFCGVTVLADAILTEDQHCTGNGIVVGADGVTIDLGGFALSGDGDFPDTGIDVGTHSNVTIKNGTVAIFFVGIVSDLLSGGASHLKLSNLTSRDNVTHGANVSGAGVVVEKSLFIHNGFDGLLVSTVGGKLTRSVFA